MANLGRLPPELKIAIVDVLFDQGSPSEDFKHRDTVISALAALSLADRFFNLVAEPKLYNLGVLRHPYLLCWATDVGYLNVMKKILSVSGFHANAGVIRYRPQDEYKEWNQDTESAKQRFDRHYRRDGEVFQVRSDWLQNGDFGEYRDSIADYIDDEQQEEDDDDDNDNEDGVDWALWKRFDAEVFGVVRWLDDDLDHLDILREPKAVYWFPVHIAARQGNFEALVLLVEFGALLNISSKGFCVHASDPNNQDCLHFPNWTDGFDPTVMYPAWTPYHIALCHGHQGVAYFILEICPHISERLLFEGDGITRPIPKFITAMRHSYPDFAELCLERELDAIEETHPDVFDGTLVWRAFWELENFELALEILLRHGADLEHDLGDGHTLLVEACYHGHYREALALIDAGANFNNSVHDPGPGTNMEEAIQDRNHWTLNAITILELCCGLHPSWVWSVPVSLPSCDAALAVVSQIIDSGVKNVIKNVAVLTSARFHQVDTLEFLLKAGGDLHDPEADDSSALDHATRLSPEWGLQEWSEDLLPTFSIIINHAKNTGRQLEGVAVAEKLLKVFASARKDKEAALCITDTILLLVSEGLVDVNHHVGTETLMAQAASMRNCRLLRGLFDLGARDNLVTLWSNAFYFDTEPYCEESANEIYQTLATIESEGRIFKDPYFVATAMSSWAWSVVNLMEPHLHLDKDWVNKTTDHIPVRNRSSSFKSDFDGWSLLHFAARFGHTTVCRRLVAMRAGIHSSAKGGETPLSLALEIWASSHTIVKLLVESDPQLDAETVVKYRSIAEDKINNGHWSDAAAILALYPRGGLSDIKDPLLLHAAIQYRFSRSRITNWNFFKQLIRSGTDVNAIDEDGHTPLGYLLALTISAVEKDTYHTNLDAWVYQSLKSLIIAGAKPSIRNRKGQSVLELLNTVRGWKGRRWWVSEVLTTTLLYQVMLYRQSIGM
ncbi:Serine/threonine-protein kinase TNNI3K [Colletotrichum siamense]|uniref:Serine/threonine-protein kinase TNNI3K n=1 Tax=Colletotrichum siamense TaxID=690259 RepID=A0A9P5F106_COLSI|nr:Serine/threonine-protein kinase TNNI3K [Colletotrichum siamense]KAF4863844.1 Serine/threonine-protein kinase TNNI3K [Colletotrichum siamense]